MTPDQFDSLAKDPQFKRMTLGSVAAARRVLVDGENRSEVARSVGLTPQRIAAIVQKFESGAEGIPLDWVQVIEWLPFEMAIQVKNMAADAKASLTQGESKKK